VTEQTRTSIHDRIHWAGLIAGPVLAALTFALLPAATTPEQAAAHTALTLAGRATAGLMVWMATWWITEAIDIAATSLLPLAVLPLFTLGEHSSASAAVTSAAAPYANPFIALFLGGFMISLAMERWNLHRRIALVALRFVGSKPSAIVAGFMAITALLSMWVSNTATAVMMLPVAMSVIHVTSPGESIPRDPEKRSTFATCLVLCIAYSASIGGIGTLIGTPPNLILAGFLEEQYGISISFVRWLGVGLPLVVVFIPIVWLVMTRFVYPVPHEPIAGGHEAIVEALDALGPPSRGERATFVIFLVTAVAWITSPLLRSIAIAGGHPLAGLSDPGIAIIAALALFIVPVDIKTRTFVLDWDSARRLPWGILILFGGGLSLADAVKHYAVAEFIGVHAHALAVLPGLLIVALVAAAVVLLTELTSNTATTATLLPILAGLAPSLGIHPALLLIPTTIAASCAFMMPVATPPNAIVFGSGHVTIPQMVRAGMWLVVIGLVLIVILAYAIALPLFAGLFR
jgi:sodium-dependent dicarboxylate transporter 2/3/5